ncbi:MAG TPA: tRNA 2-thiouridine(34) synthase MnmA [Solirubrobacterales bacterium]|nr:tRNA 2-thiouridine(34) synthase MnmA [Solirubrobacterales bacterium]
MSEIGADHNSFAMDRELLEEYLADDSRRGPAPEGAFSGSAGGAPCGDLVRLSLSVADGRIEAVSFDQEGCAATMAAAAATAELADGAGVLDAARIGPDEVATELGGLGPSHRHAAVLAADALHRALSGLAGSGAPLAPAPDEGARVLVALSGGVDSAVAALREREAGREVVAVTLKLWADQRTDGERSCCSPEAVLGARRLAHSLGLPHLTLDLETEFRAGVVGPFLRGYAQGRTPNPCVLCNGDLRIDAMIALAERLGAGTLATGHYARIVNDGDGPLLSAAADPAKDQTYMLSGLRPDSLARLRFPLAELTKRQVRETAAGAGLEVAGRAESQDLCFLAGQGKREFLRRHAGLEDRPGEVVDRRGRRLGPHNGHHHFTVGQRRGLGLGGGDPLYVIRTDAAKNRVIAGPRSELATRNIRIRGARLHRPAERVDGVRLRYHSPRRDCRLELNGDPSEAIVSLAEPVDGAAPGQVACLLAGDLVVGHGTVV